MALVVNGKPRGFDCSILHVKPRCNERDGIFRIIMARPVDRLSTILALGGGGNVPL